MPGHTPADMAYLIDSDVILVGDTLFMPDVGTARCDFPGGNANQMFASIHKLLAFPASVRLYVCHDYPPAGPRTSVHDHGGRAAQKQHSHP